MSRRKSTSVQRVQPRRVVAHARRVRSLEVEEPLELAADAVRVRRDLLGREQLPLRRLPARVADHPRPATDERDRPMTEALQMHEHHDRHEAAHVQAVPRRVESDVRRHRPAGQRCRHPVGVLVHQPTPPKLVEHSVRLHGTKVGAGVSDCQATAARRIDAGLVAGVNLPVGPAQRPLADTRFSESRSMAFSLAQRSRIFADVTRSSCAGSASPSPSSPPSSSASALRAGRSSVAPARVRRSTCSIEYQPRQTSKLYAADGRFIAELGLERRTLLKIDQIPPLVRNAFVMTEDKRFYQHAGIDWHRIPGAILADIKHRSFAEGFSTITMQLARKSSPRRSSSRPKQLRRSDAQAQGSEGRARHRGEVLEGQDPRALSQSDPARQRLVRRRDGGAAVLRQVGARSQRRRGGDARRAAQGAGALQSASRCPSAPSSGATPSSS